MANPVAGIAMYEVNKKNYEVKVQNEAFIGSDFRGYLSHGGRFNVKLGKILSMESIPGKIAEALGIKV